jgi:hypothetical protein
MGRPAVRTPRKGASQEFQRRLCAELQWGHDEDDAERMEVLQTDAVSTTNPESTKEFSVY